MKALNLWVILAIATVVLVGAISLILLAPTCPSGTATVFCIPGVGTVLDVTAILGLIGLAAVGIERFIEGIWSVVDICAGSFWPLNVVAKQIEGQVDALGQPLEPFIKQFSDLVDKGSINLGNLKPEEVKNNLKNDIDQVKRFAARNGSSQLFVAGAEQKLRELQKQYQIKPDQIDIETIVKNLQGGVKDFDDFVKSFKDNPGRKLVSLYIGIVVGLVVALFFKLDLLATMLKDGQHHSVVLGIILAGVIMGLGSSPTHEIVQAILNYRQSLKKTK